MMRWWRALARGLGLAAMLLASTAHVGSPDTWFRGQAGPYDVQVVVRLPGVVPGLGQIDVTVDGDDVTRVTAQPALFNVGSEGAPPADVASRVASQPRAWHAELWFMAQATYRVRIEVTGARGTGTVEVPVVAAALQQVPLAPWLGGVLLLAGGFLVVGALTIVRSGATDAIAAPGDAVTSPRSGTTATVVGAALLTLMLFGGWRWWQAVEQDYQRELYRPASATAAIDTAGGARTLVFAVQDSNWMVHRIGPRLVESPIVQDHGKVMHLFLIERGADGARPIGFGHYHPVTRDSITFRAALGRLGAGRYDVYADVVHETGLPQTLVASVEVPPPLARDSGAFTDPDDVVHAARPEDARVALGGGGEVRWERGAAAPLAGRDAGLRFTVRDAAGSVVRLAPYLGMAGHAVVQRADGGVYIHLHPNGTVSMGAQAALAVRQREDTAPGMVARRIAAAADGHEAHGAQHRPAFDGTLVFPYAFPAPGEYRVWVQFRREGGAAVETAMFRVVVPAV